MDSFGPKQPYEEYYVDFDFKNVIVSPDTIATAAIKVVDELGVDATSTFTTLIKQNITSPKVYVWIKAGAADMRYTITCQIVTTNGEKYEKDGKILVEEINYLNR